MDIYICNHLYFRLNLLTVMACFRYGSAYPQTPGVGVSGHSYRLPDHPTESGQTAALPTRVTQDLPDRGQVSRTCEYLCYQNVAQCSHWLLIKGSREEYFGGGGGGSFKLDFSKVLFLH